MLQQILGRLDDQASKFQDGINVISADMDKLREDVTRQYGDQASKIANHAVTLTSHHNQILLLEKKMEDMQAKMRRCPRMHGSTPC